MRVLVCGSRHWRDKKAIRMILEELPRDTVIIHGGAVGADRLAGEVAKELKFDKIIVFPAQWRKYGQAAGPIRNKRMLIEGKPDTVYAFHPNIEQSAGTRNMVEQAKKAGIPVRDVKVIMGRRKRKE